MRSLRCPLQGWWSFIEDQSKHSDVQQWECKLVLNVDENRLLLQFQAVVCQSCPYSEDTIFPRQFGGNLGDTQILSFDYQFDSATTTGRIAVSGFSNSQDVTSHVGSGFLTYEDAINYEMLWAKEFYQTNYAGQNLQVVQCSINIQQNIVYAGTQGPLVIMMLNGLDGSLLHSKILFCNSGSTFCSGVWNIRVSNILYVPVADRVVVYFRDMNYYDYVISTSAQDLVTGQATYQLWNSPNIQGIRFMKAGVDLSGTTPYIETMGIITPGGVNYMVNFVALMTGGGFTQLLQSTQSFSNGVADTNILIAGGGNIRIGCMHSNSDLLSQQSQNFQFFIQNDRPPAFNNWYTWVVGATPWAMICRQAQVTADFRMFFFYEYYAAGAVSRVQAIMEATTTTYVGAGPLYNVYISALGLIGYTSNIFGSLNAFYRIFYNPSGNAFFLHSTNALSLRGATTFNTGYLMKDYIDAVGDFQMVTSSYCFGTFSVSSKATLSPQGIFVWNAMPVLPILGDFYLMVFGDDSNKVIDMQMQDLALFQLYKPGCVTPPTPAISLPIPTIDLPLYYIVGYDIGIKSYPLTPSTIWASLSQCQSQVISFAIRMQDGSALPRFISLDRAAFALKANVPVIAEIGTYLLQVVVYDIYGNTLSLDVTLIVANILATPGIANCYSEPIILQGSAFDVVYVIGTLKQNKLHFQAPYNSLHVSCQPLMVITAYQVDNTGNLLTLPSYISLDSTNRVLSISMTTSQGQAFVSQTLKVEIVSWIIDYPTPKTRFQFSIYVTDQASLGCPGYFQIQAPYIPDIILTQSYSSLWQMHLTPFALNNGACNSQTTIQTRAILTNYQPLPSCASIDFVNNHFSIIPSSCAGPLPLVLNIRLEAWIYNSTIGLHTHSNFTVFRVDLIGIYQCLAIQQIWNSGTPIYYEYHFSDVDAPASIQNYFYSNFYILSPYVYTYPNSLSYIGLCDGAYEYFYPLNYQDEDFTANPIITQPWTTLQSYGVQSPSMITSNIGVYDIKFQAQYMYSDYKTRYHNVQLSIVYFKFHLYQSSLCKFVPGKGSTFYLYQMQKNLFQMQIWFKPFKMLTDGCIYDKFQYGFFSQGGASLPSFIIVDESTLMMNVSTNKLAYYGSYNLELTGSLNPNLLNTFSFEIQVAPYPNTGPPKFSGSLQNPLFVNIGQDIKYPLPAIKDPDGDQFTLQVSIVGALTFPSCITFDQVKNTFEISPANASNVGSYQFLINITDIHPLQQLTKLYYLEINVQLYSLAQYQAFLNKQQKSQQQKFVGVTVSSVSNTGLLVITFNVSLFNNYTGPSQFNNKSLQLEMQKAYSTQTYNIPWQVENVTTNEIFIFLNFSDPATISMYSQKDQLLVKFEKGVPLLESQVNQTTSLLQLLLSQMQGGGTNSQQSVVITVGQNIVLESIIPKQVVYSSLAAAIKKSAVYMKGTANTILFSNLILNIFMSGSIQMLWGTINTLQLIVLATLFNLSFPDNCIVMFNIVADISQFSLIPTTQMVSSLFTFDDSDPVNENFAAMGYSATAILQNLNMILFFIVGIIPVFSIVLTINLLLPRGSKAERWFKPIYVAVFFSTTLRTLLEGYIEMSLSATINLFDLKFQQKGDQASAIMSVVVALVDYLMPIGILYFIFMKRSRVADKDFESRFGSIYEGLKVKRPIHLMCTFFFLIRRLLLVLTTIVLQNYPAFQVMVFILFSQLSIMYLVYFKPYEDPYTNLTEIFNESCVLLSAYQLFVFTDFVDSLQMKNLFGFGMIATILMNFGVNILIQIISALSILPKVCKRLKSQSPCRSSSKHQIPIVKEPVTEESKKSKTPKKIKKSPGPRQKRLSKALKSKGRPTDARFHGNEDDDLPEYEFNQITYQIGTQQPIAKQMGYNPYNTDIIGMSSNALAELPLGRRQLNKLWGLHDQMQMPLPYHDEEYVRNAGF